ncbi:MAG: hypothetical protein ABSE00_03885 [Chitinispirillaceae bacterium]
MKGKILFFAVAIMLSGCASYTQLKPKPKVANVESGYVELKKGKNNFTLKKNSKYFVTFPAPEYDHFYLIITSPEKSQFTDAFTAEFAKKQPGTLIADETWAADTMSVFPVDKSHGAYYWLIQQVPKKIEKVTLRYRYAPQWRFKFEHNYDSYRQTLLLNRVDRTVYNAIGVSMHLDDFNYTLVMDSVSKHTGELLRLKKDLADLESIFPPNVVNSYDVAYQNYQELKKSLDDELLFQTNYVNTLGFFYRGNQTKNTPYAYLGYIDDFIGYFATKADMPEPIVKESQAYLQKRFSEVPPFLAQRIQAKDDVDPFDTAYFRMGALRKVDSLYAVAGVAVSPDVAALVKFMIDFDAKTRVRLAIHATMDSIANQVKACPNMPPVDFFNGICTRVGALQNGVPTGIDGSYGDYQNYPCAKRLNQELGTINTTLLQLAALYRDAANLVMQLNILKDQNDYTAMIVLLKQNPNLSFLIDKYRDLDRLSLEQQENAIGAALAANKWGAAETNLRKLFADQDFLDPTSIPPKENAVRSYEDSLYSKVERVTRGRVDKFCNDNVATYENIDSLYADSVFLPAYNITFTSGGRADLVARQSQLAADLERIKETDFPAKSIRLLYDQLLKSPDDNGVYKARAIVAHGKHYTGSEKEIKMRIAEADPLTPKWITKAKEPRRVFVVPITDNPHGKNKYVVRFNIDIPTNAVFPVYEVNIKLPKEVAQNASSAQWYDEITCNKVPLKNEGRFSIIAPTAANDYECQIAPVQMNKNQANVLEIVFRYNAFKVLQISVMVQNPIIKKN